MKADFFASEAHFLDHLVPIFRALPAEARGRIFLPRGLDHHAYARGVERESFFWTSRAVLMTELRRSQNLLVVSATGNVKFGNWTGRPVVLCQHGAGQSYGNRRNASYAGYPGHKGIALFIHPGPHPAGRDRPLYPKTPIAVVGCPKLDDWHKGKLKLPKNPKPKVAISFHWTAKIGVSEALGLGQYYEPGLKSLVGREEFDIFGHAHPRYLKEAKAMFEKAGIPIIRDFAEVMATCDVYVVDNSSTLFEFASTGRPVVVLNGPAYRKDVKFGVRFWDAAHVGVNCEEPKDLFSCIVRAIEDRGDLPRLRADALSKVYAHQDGRAAARAAAAIVAVIDERKRKPNKSKEATMNEPKNVAMIATVTCYDPEDGYLKRGQSFKTTESRARMYEQPIHNIARRAPVEAEPSKTKPAGPSKTKPAGPEATKVDDPSTNEGAELDVPTDEDKAKAIEQAMRDRVSFGPIERGWTKIYVDGIPVQSARPAEKEEIARALIADDLKKNG